MEFVAIQFISTISKVCKILYSWDLAAPETEVSQRSLVAVDVDVKGMEGYCKGATLGDEKVFYRIANAPQ